MRKFGALVLGMVFIGCGADGNVSFGPNQGATESGALTSTTGTLGTVGADNTWTWYNDPNFVCGASGPTPTTAGFAVNALSSAGGGNGKVMIFFAGGGMCTDAASCMGPFKTETNFTYSQTQFNTDANTYADSVNSASGVSPYTWSQPVAQRGVFDRTSGTANPFADYNMVIIPYCTGDLFMGKRHDTSSSIGRTPSGFYFEGYSNVTEVAAQVKKLFPSPTSVSVLGGSAGAFGASYNYPQFRAQWPSTVTINTIADAGVPYYTGTPTANYLDFGGSGNGRPGFLLSVIPPVMYNSTSETVDGVYYSSINTNWAYNYQEDAWNDAWGLASTKPSNVTCSTPYGAKGNICSYQAMYLSIVNAAATANPNDVFGLMAGQEDWVAPYYLHLNITHPNPPAPNVNQGQADISANVKGSNVKTLWVSSTSQYPVGSSGPLMLPYNQYHTYTWQGAASWSGATGKDQSGNSTNVASFLSTTYFPSF